MSDVPLKIRIDVRDTWNGQDKPLQAAVDELAKATGIRVVPEGLWAELWATLGPNFSENRYFVQSIAQIVTAWYRQIATRVERAYEPEWNEVLLKTLKESGDGQTIPLVAQPSATTTKFHSRWDKDAKKFFIDIPSSTGLQMLSFTYDFERDFDEYFPEPPAPPPPPPASFSGSAPSQPQAADNAGTWTNAAAAPGPAPVSLAVGPRQPMRMPTVDSVPRPSAVLKTLAPHYLVFNSGSFPAWIQCSHEPTLVFLSDYLTKHGKTNDADPQRRTMFKTELRDSRYCHGLRDLLLIDSHVELRGVSVVNPTFILAIVEGVLGYRRVDSQGNYFVLRHDNGFA